MAGWEPVLAAELWPRCVDAVRQIAGALSPLPPAWSSAEASMLAREARHASLGWGKAGFAVFFDYLGRTALLDGMELPAKEALSEAAAAVTATPMTVSLWGGLSGIGWGISRGVLKANDDVNVLGELDEALHAFLLHHPPCREFDLIVGLVGVGIYALERMPSPTARECLELIVSHLAALAKRVPDGLTWLTPPRKRFPYGRFDLGVAHGVPGVLGFLGLVYEANVSRELALELLEGAVSWLRVQRAPSGLPWFFVPFLEPGVGAPPPRLAWCSGDPGIAAVLLATARRVGKAEWEALALEVGHAAASRRGEDIGVDDECFCHGSAGLAHIFNRMFQATHDPTFLEATRYWFARTLDFARPAEGFGGFGVLRLGNGETKIDPGFLMGATGTGLALASAVASVEPTWDRLFLLSVPRCSGES